MTLFCATLVFAIRCYSRFLRATRTIRPCYIIPDIGYDIGLDVGYDITPDIWYDIEYDIIPDIRSDIVWFHLHVSQWQAVGRRGRVRQTLIFIY